MTNPNDSSIPIIETKIGERFAMPCPIVTSNGGLTKREHMAIEFCKALVTAQISNEEGNAILALKQADELIKQLNETK